MTKTDLSAARGALRRLVPVALGLGCLWLLAGQLAGLDWAAVKTCFLDIPLWRWALAGLAAAASFGALAQYDLIAHRHIGTGVDPRAARRAGASAIALGQVTGVGPVVGAAVRWRLLPGLANGDILRLTAFLTLTFIAAWATLMLAVALPVVVGLPWLAPIALVCLMALGGAALLRWPELQLRQTRLRLPSLPAAGTMLGLTFLDLLFAATALWLLFPQGAAPGLALFAAAYGLSLGAGLIAGTPGGAGPFELALVTLLPQTGTEELVAALLGYRILYYALPAGLAALYALLSRPSAQTAQDLPQAHCFKGARAEHAIAAQSPSLTLETADARATLLSSAQCLALFLGPQRGALQPLLPRLRQEARRRNRLPLLYKLSPRDAVVARQQGWAVAQQGFEAVLDPQDYTLSTPARRQLRRALRKAETAGVTVDRPKAPDWITLAQINATWTARHGTERGFTMGRFCTAYLEGKPVFVARQHGRIIAFGTLVTSPGCQSLDIIRHLDDVPNGTMHALVHAMITQAQRSGIRSFSLAGLPNARMRRFAEGADGLARFKTAFAPKLAPRYAAAPDYASLLIAAADLWRSVRHPPPLQAPEPEHGWQVGPQQPESDAIRLAS